MRIQRISVRLAVLGCALVFFAAPAARAANNAIFRDCSLLTAPIDADFLHLSGVVVGSNGSLTVPPSQSFVELTASESFDPGDNTANVSLRATITSPGIASQTVSGWGLDFVVLRLPLNDSTFGRVYTISWAATFDNRQHACPSALTLENTPSDPNPFVVTVSH